MQIGVTVSLHRDVMGSTFRPLEIHTSFSVPHEDVESYSKLFGCSAISNQEENRVVFDASWLDGTPQFGNEITYASVVALCDDLHEELAFRLGIMGKVRELLLATIGRNTSFEKVAHELDMPVRTLSRKLAGHGTSFRDLKDRLRAHAATKYLRDTEMTTEDIAHVLGFSDTASFRRAFRRWTRTSPKNFRRGLSMTS
jgi:AraC-like DNA-binding protein